MARDDYHVVVYQILSYLYQQLKQGNEIDVSLIKHDSKYLQINRKYWMKILMRTWRYIIWINVRLHQKE